jgi:2OG-Fe(II) oxygenase superfamily
MKTAETKLRGTKTIKNFSPDYRAMRSHFEERFTNRESIDANRFVWDLWHVPNQYRLLRTPAYQFFPEKLYTSFHKNLVLWGRKNLGCWDISPPWMSCYLNDHEQQFHCDVPHGPWAFVYSMCAEKISFSGGETQLMTELALNFWRLGAGASERESQALIEKISPTANQLLVFDPRIPHGVTPVKNAVDLIDGRLVIHGWFSQPKTYIEGPLPAKLATKILNQAFTQVSALVQNEEIVWGSTAIGLSIASSGAVESAKIQSSNLRSPSGDSAQALEKKLLKIYSGLKFPSAKAKTWATVPLIFDN